MRNVTYSALNRREVVKAFASVGVGIAMMPVLARPALAAREVHYHTWAGYDAEPLFAEPANQGGNMSEEKVYKFDGEQLDVSWDGRLCIHVGECTRAKGELFVSGREPWARPDLGEIILDYAGEGF